MRIKEKDIYRVLQMTDQQAGELFKKYLKAKQGYDVAISTDLEENLCKDIRRNKPKAAYNYHNDTYFVYNVALNYFPEHLHPKDSLKKTNWLQTIDSLLRLDRVPAQLLLEIIKRAREDDFWSKNFLSITKLRKNNRDGVKYIQVFAEKFKRNEKQNSSSFRQEILRKLQS